MQRLLLWLFANTLYLIMTTFISLAVSLRARTAASATVILLSIWAASTLVMPRLAANIVEVVTPSTEASAFWLQVATDEKNGVDGQGGAKGAADFRTRTLQRFGVSSADQLQMNFAGLRLNEGERVNAYVFDKRHGELHTSQDRQRRLLRIAEVILPVTALQNISMGLSGTDEAHQRNFADQAEQHRRSTVQQLNGEMAAHAGKLDFNCKADPSFWGSVPAFHYIQPRWADFWSAWLPDALVLIAWLALSIILLRVAERKLRLEAL